MASKRLAVRLPSLLLSSPHASSSSSAAAACSSSCRPTPSRLVPAPSSRSFSTSLSLLARKDAASPASKKAAASSSTSSSPIPDLRIGEIAPNRLRDYYHNSLSDDLLYLTYSHNLAIDPELPQANLSWLEKDPAHPFAANRPHPKAPGRRNSYIPVRHAVNEKNVPQLESIVISTFVREAIARKSQLLPAIHALRTITGQVDKGYNDVTRTGVEIVVGKKGAATWNLRSGMPVGAKVTLKGDDMYRFIETLTEFVFPRIRDWPGVKLQQDGVYVEPTTADETGGVVSLGFGPDVMALFPQIEACLSFYTRLPGFNVNFVTNQRGRGAKWRARQLLSGFRFPFFTPEKEKKRARYGGKGKKGRK